MQKNKILKNASLIFLIVAMFGCKTKGAGVPQFLPCSHDVFMWALMMAESSGNPNEVYHESFGTDSLGLFQVSLEDAKRYGCNFNKREDAFDPARNRDCAEKIIAKLHLSYPNENWSQSLGRYFSSLRRGAEWGADYTGFSHFVTFALQRGCVISN